MTEDVPYVPPLTPEDWLKLREETAAASMDVVVREVAGNSDNALKALLPYQQRAFHILNAGAEVLVVEKSRRIGLTWGLASYAVLRAARRRDAHGMDVLYISYSQDMTREFIDACAMWARAFGFAASAMDEFLFDDELDGHETRSIKAFRISFASGFEIVGLSSAPRSLRGKQGVVFIDEAAFVDNLEQLLEAALALLVWGGQVIICSTHYGTDNPFNQVIRNIHTGKSQYAHMRIDFDDALREGLYRRICFVKGEEWSEEKEKLWRDKIVAFYGDGADQELFCVPAQGSGTWLSTELIERQMTLPRDPHVLRWQWPRDYLDDTAWNDTRRKRHLDEHLRQLDVALSFLSPQERHALGFDFARVHNGDLSVATVLAVDSVLMRAARLVLEMRGVPYEEQRAIVDHLWKKLPRQAGAAFDATGAGGFIAEAMSRSHGKYDPKEESGGSVAEIKLSAEWYRLHMPRVKAAFEEGTIILPKDDDLLGDLRVVKLVKGVAVIPATRTGETGLRRHGDFAVALALAWYATLMNVAEYGYEGLGLAATQRRDSFYTPPSDRDDWRGGGSTGFDVLASGGSWGGSW